MLQQTGKNAQYLYKPGLLLKNKQKTMEKLMEIGKSLSKREQKRICGGLLKMVMVCSDGPHKGSAMLCMGNFFSCLADGREMCGPNSGIVIEGSF